MDWFTVGWCVEPKLDHHKISNRPTMYPQLTAVQNYRNSCLTNYSPLSPYYPRTCRYPKLYNPSPSPSPRDLKDLTCYTATKIAQIADLNFSKTTFIACLYVQYFLLNDACLACVCESQRCTISMG